MNGWIDPIRSLANRRGGPTFFALALAIISIPFATLAIMLAGVDSSGDPTPVDTGLALVMALVAVVAGALVGGTLGGLVVRRRPLLGLGLAIGSAWPTALATLSIVPGLVGREYGAVRMCFDSCSPVIRGDSTLSAIAGYGISLLFTAIVAVPAAGILLFIAWELGRRRRRALQPVFVAAAVVAIDSWSMWSGALAAAALVAGSLVWVLPHRPGAEAGAIDPPDDAPVPPGWGR